MEGSLIEQGGTLMLVGMGTVFVFLTALVLALTLLARVARLFDEETLTTTDPAPDEVAAITAAIAKHRSS